MEQELLTIPELLSSPPVFSGVRVIPSLVLCVCFVDGCLSFCPFSFGHFVVCYSSIYGFWLPLWYLQTLLKTGQHAGSNQVIRENTRLVIIYRNCQTFPGVYMNQFWGDNYNLIHLQHVWMYVRQLNHVIVEQVMMTTIKHCKIWLDEIGTSCIANATVFSFKENKGIKKIKFVVACH